jgi:rubredoxin
LEKAMSDYECSVCGWVYNEEEGFPEGGITPGTTFEDLPDDWFCPFCSADKDKFNKLPGS